MEKMGEVANDAMNMGGGSFIQYVIGAFVIYYLYKQFKEKGIIDKLEAKLDELKDKLDK